MRSMRDVVIVLFFSGRRRIDLEDYKVQTALKRIAIIMLRFLCFVALRCRVYYVWSIIYRVIFGMKYRRVILPKINDLLDLQKIISQMDWRPDGVLELGDAISNAKIAWGRNISGKGSNDCDDISAFAADRIQTIIKSATSPVYPGVEDIISADILTCCWKKNEKFAVGGHNVCIFLYHSTHGFLTYGWMSNWYDGVPRLGYTYAIDVIMDILKEAGNPIPLGAAMVSSDLTYMFNWWSAKDIAKRIRKE